MLTADLVNWDAQYLQEMAQSNQIVGCDHERQLLTYGELKDTVEKALPILRRHKTKFDSFVVTGYSSSLIASTLALKMKKNITLLRKDTEERHSRHKFEGVLGSRNVFVDDLVSSGKTLEFVYKRLKEFHCSLYGVYLYVENWNVQTDGVNMSTLVRCTDTIVKNLNRKA
jgi:orotate phosphoribosyltransferase